MTRRQTPVIAAARRLPAFCKVVARWRPHSGARTQSGFLLKAAPAIDPDRTSIGGPTLGFPDSNICPPDSLKNAPELHERILFARITDQFYTADSPATDPRTKDDSPGIGTGGQRAPDPVMCEKKREEKIPTTRKA